jgi:hypothetical protein
MFKNLFLIVAAMAVCVSAAYTSNDRTKSPHGIVSTMLDTLSFKMTGGSDSIIIVIDTVPQINSNKDSVIKHGYLWVNAQNFLIPKMNFFTGKKYYWMVFNYQPTLSYEHQVQDSSNLDSFTVQNYPVMLNPINKQANVALSPNLFMWNKIHDSLGGDSPKDTITYVFTIYSSNIYNDSFGVPYPIFSVTTHDTFCNVNMTTFQNGAMYFCKFDSIYDNGASFIYDGQVRHHVIPNMVDTFTTIPSFIPVLTLYNSMNPIDTVGEKISIAGNNSHYYYNFKAVSLPAGLTIDSVYGGISGKLTTVSAKTQYIISARCIFLGAWDTLHDTVYIQVVAQPVAPTILTQPHDTMVYFSNIAKFTVTASGTAPLVYKWLKNGTDSVGSSNVLTLTAKSTSWYKCLVKNNVGSVYSAACTLHVDTISTITKPVVKVNNLIQKHDIRTYSITGQLIRQKFTSGIFLNVDENKNSKKFISMR